LITVASTEDEIKSLIRSKRYSSREEVISDAIEALLMKKPELKKEIASESLRDMKNAERRLKKDRMTILESYIGILKPSKSLTSEEILDLEEDNWLY
jgi:Arc/MetJ-type ribon-helix-helix transcriptional regulator